MVFRSDLESVFPGAWYRFINMDRLTRMVESFNLVEGTGLDALHDKDGEVVAARLKSGVGETIFFTACTSFETLKSLRDIVEDDCLVAV